MEKVTIGIVFFSLLTFALSQHVEHPDGRSDHFHTQDDVGNFNFGYDTARADGSRDSRSERGDAYGNIVGSYSLVDTDGRSRIVDYTAGENGFQAVVRTNEPGTSNQSPAFVSMSADPPQTGYGTGRQPGPVVITRPTTTTTLRRRQVARPNYRPYRPYYGHGHNLNYNSLDNRYDPYNYNAHNIYNTHGTHGTHGTHDTHGTHGNLNHGYADYTHSSYYNNYDRYPYYNNNYYY